MVITSLVAGESFVLIISFSFVVFTCGKEAFIRRDSDVTADTAETKEINHIFSVKKDH